MGANDGILSTASLILGVAAAGATGKTVVITGIAGLVAGAMAMAAGEYVSVSSQADTEEADLVLEQKELDTDDKFERAELAGNYVSRGLDPALARQVADQLMAHDALGAHARDELGISEIRHSRPVLAAFTSAGTFAVGAALPLIVVILASASTLAMSIVGTSLLFLAILGSLAARVGGASPTIGALRVTFWGALAMALTYGVGILFGTLM
jgi:VIT1/CCC1 family predicted Fe2+/Mn2+ transporter